MGAIFVSYRREDSAGWAGRLTADLRRVFSSLHVDVFMDIDTVPPGVNFEQHISGAVGSCDVLIALIGPRWLTAADARGARRLDDPEDFTRIEIAAALRRDIRVIPVLVGGATLPRADDLPDDIKSLARRQSYEMADHRWPSDCERLIDALRRVVRPQSSGRSRLALATAIVLLLLIAGYGILSVLRPDTVQPAPGLAGERSRPAPTPTGPASHAGKPGDEPPPTAAPKREVPSASSVASRSAASERRQDAEKHYQQAKIHFDTKNYVEAAQWYFKAAEAGHVEAQVKLGEMYTHGLGVPANVRDAIGWYRRAAEQGNLEGMYGLAQSYTVGRGARDEAESFAWLRKAAEGGHSNAQAWLASWYQNGGSAGVERNDAEALKWYLRAAAQGNVTAVDSLAAMYAEGRGVTASQTEAAKWYRKGAESGSPFAAYELGRRYAYGIGVEQSDQEAIKWYRRAAKQGIEAARDELKKRGLGW